jgi:hypothetical protein
MEGYALHIQTIEESLTDILQEHRSARHQIRDAGVQRIDVIIGIGPDINEFSLARLGIFAVTYRRYAPLMGCL